MSYCVPTAIDKKVKIMFLTGFNFVLYMSIFVKGRLHLVTDTVIITGSLNLDLSTFDSTIVRKLLTQSTYERQVF